MNCSNIILTAICIPMLIACSSDNKENSDVNLSREADILHTKELTLVEFKSLTEKADHGDIVSANRLLTHYAVVNDVENFNKWTVWLADRGDDSALASRFTSLYSSALDLNDTDPSKICLLKAARFYASIGKEIKENNTFMIKSFEMANKQIDDLINSGSSSRCINSANSANSGDTNSGHEFRGHNTK